MSLYHFVAALGVSLCWRMLVLAAENPAAEDHPAAVKPAVHTAAPGPAAVKPAGNSTSPAGNSTVKAVEPAPGSAFSVNSSMIQRALYVLIGITLMGMLYFLIRAVRLKKPAPKKKYGLLSDYDDSVEMEGVESDEDDTLYEARGLRR